VVGCWSTVNRIFTEDLAENEEQCGWRKKFGISISFSIMPQALKEKCGESVNNCALPVLFSLFFLYLKL
jgi:predicted 3-demethylubiquinone-9 3-methyltransferase (glyoxalase superfamily)